MTTKYLYLYLYLYTYITDFFFHFVVIVDVAYFVIRFVTVQLSCYRFGDMFNSKKILFQPTLISFTGFPSLDFLPVIFPLL